MQTRLVLWFVLLCVLGCSDADKTFIPKSPDPPPTQKEGTLQGPSKTDDGKTSK